MNMRYIGVISDTHGLLRQEVKDRLSNCDVILHGGDINNQEIISELQEIAHLHVVRGNADKELAESLPLVLKTELFGIKILLLHNIKNLPADINGTDLVVFGHSHKYVFKEENGYHYLNPGSCGPRRFHQPITMAVIEVMDSIEYEVKRIDIPHNHLSENIKIPEKEHDRRKLVEQVIMGVDKGYPVEKISKSNHIDLELTEQICRMYLTHPGIDIDGILNRISSS